MAADGLPGRLRTVVSIVGTRPEAIKLAPVVRALRDHGGFEQQVFLTGQHRGLSSRFEGLPDAAVQRLAIDPSEQSAGEIRDIIHDQLCGRLSRHDVDLVLVQGDTSSAYAGALAARDCGIPLGHVEAGLRSFDLQQPWPEEVYRIAIDRLSDLLFAPTESAVRNLENERGVLGEIHLTGNTGIDALFDVLKTLPASERPATRRRRILLTCHRRENRGEPSHRIAEACRRLVRELPVEIVLPLHTSPAVREQLQSLLGGDRHIHLVEPLDHREMIAAMVNSWLVLTDSGGIQEEAPALGRPVLVLRDVTERPEALHSANAELVGTDPDRIVTAVARLIGDPQLYASMAQPAYPFGDGHASARIVAAIDSFLAKAAAQPKPAAAPILAAGVP